MSNESLDTLRTALLIFSVVILVAVLYKRLLILLGKNKNKPRYVLVDDHELDTGNKKLSLNIALPEPAMVKIELFADNGSTILLLHDEKLSSGTHRLEFNLSTLVAGRYYFKLATHNHSVMQYFSIS